MPRFVVPPGMTEATAPFAPMEALLVAILPDGEGWQFEPKWDGFRCIVTRDGDEVALWSKSGKPLDRYFPEVVARIAAMKQARFVIDGELLIETGGAMSFEALQARLHPAASRIAKLSAATPALFMAFDCLAVGKEMLLTEPLVGRRAALEKLLAKEVGEFIRLSPASADRIEAASWFDAGSTALDGVIGKRLADPYRPGERAMVKVKARRSADCVVGGFRREAKGNGVASLLLGLHGDDGLLHHVGFTSSIAARDRSSWTSELDALAGGIGFTGKAPGGPSRWAAGRSAAWTPLKPELVVEVAYDQVTGERFRHGTKLLRRRPDKAPAQCTMEQLRRPLTKAEVAALLG